MECLLQYMDEIDDLIGVFGLLSERIRGLVLAMITLFVGVAVAASGALLAVVHPPVGLAICILLFVTLLYRKVTSTSHNGLQSV